MDKFERRLMILITVLAVELLFCVSTRAAVVAPEVGYTYMRGQTPVVALSVVSPRTRLYEEALECGVFYIAPSNWYWFHEPSQQGVQCLGVVRLNRFDMAGGLVYLNKIDHFNGSHVNFSGKLEYHFTDKYSIAVRHMSNANVKLPNLGRDVLSVIVRF